MWNFQKLYTSISKNCAECKMQLMNTKFNNIQSEWFNSCVNVNDSKDAKKKTYTFKYKCEVLNCYVCFNISYINCVVYLSRDNYAAGSAFSVVEPAWMINCQRVQFRMHPWRYLNAWKEWTEFSRQVSFDHWTRRKVTVRTLVDDRRMESFQRREKCTHQ